MSNKSAVITLDSSSDDDAVVVASSSSSTGSSQDGKRRAPKRKMEAEAEHRDVVIVEDNHQQGGYGNNFEEEEDDAEFEGVTLQRFTNARQLPLDWSELNVLDKRVVVLGGDDPLVEACIQQGQQHGARSVTVYRTFESDGNIGNLLALADAFQMDREPDFPFTTEGVTWPSWPHLDHLYTEDGVVGPFYVLVKGFKMSETNIRHLEGLETTEVRWRQEQSGKWKIVEERKKIVPVDVLIYDQSHASLTANVYALSWTMAIVKEHSLR